MDTNKLLTAFWHAILILLASVIATVFVIAMVWLAAYVSRWFFAMLAIVVVAALTYSTYRNL